MNQQNSIFIWKNATGVKQKCKNGCVCVMFYIYFNARAICLIIIFQIILTTTMEYVENDTLLHHYLRVIYSYINDHKWLSYYYLQSSDSIIMTIENTSEKYLYHCTQKHLLFVYYFHKDRWKKPEPKKYRPIVYYESWTVDLKFNALWKQSSCDNHFTLSFSFFFFSNFNW